MDAEAILHELTYAEDLPRDALRAATAQRAEMLPLFLKEIATYLAVEPAARAKPRPLFFIFHLLGEWREKAAHRPLARLLRLPGRELDAALGDAITTTTHRVMAAVFDGDPQPLYEIILDPNAEEFIRSRMCEALAMLVLRGELDGSLAGRFLRDALMDLQPQAQNFVWVGWQSAIAMLGMSDLKILVKKAFDRSFIDNHVLGFDHFEQDLRRGIERPGERQCPDDHEYTLFDDTIEELWEWYGFSEQYREDQERRQRQQAEANRARSQCHVKSLQRGRAKRPMPLRRWEKFKKCCLTTVRRGAISPEVVLPGEARDSLVH